MIVYILHSPSAGIFYTGFTTISVEERLTHHLENYYDHKSKFTSRYKDWEVFLTINCTTLQQARGIELHIKRMKSRIYIQHLKRYPDMVEKLLLKYSEST